MDRAQRGARGLRGVRGPATGFALYEQGADLVWRLQRRFAFGSGDDSPLSLSAVPRQVAQPSPACEDEAGTFAPLY